MSWIFHGGQWSFADTPDGIREGHRGAGTYTTLWPFSQTEYPIPVYRHELEQLVRSIMAGQADEARSLPSVTFDDQLAKAYQRGITEGRRLQALEQAGGRVDE